MTKWLDKIPFFTLFVTKHGLDMSVYKDITRTKG